MPNTNRPTISTHVLDTTRGAPAAGVGVSLWRLEADRRVPPEGTGKTDADGRIKDLLGGPLVPGIYRLTFDVGAYFKTGFVRRVTLDVDVSDATRSYHVPLLVSPFSCASYRGS